MGAQLLITTILYTTRVFPSFSQAAGPSGDFLSGIRSTALLTAAALPFFTVRTLSGNAGG